MKKIIVWVLSILLVLLLGFWTWSQRPGLPVEEILPSHPLAFASLAHVQEHINQAINSDLGKEIAAIDLPDVLDRNNFSQKDINTLKRWQKGLVKFWDNPLIKGLLSKEASIAVYGSGRSYHVFVAFRLTSSTKIVELLGRLANHWGDDISIKRQKYQGVVINHVFLKKQGLSVSYVCIRDLLIAAPGSLGHLEEVVDVYHHKRPTLNDDPSFNFMRRNAYRSADGLVYVNLNGILDLGRGEMASKLTPLGYQAAAFPEYGLSYMPGAVSKYKIMVGLDKKYMSSGLRKVFSCPDLPNDTLKLVPVNAILYADAGCVDFEQSWGLAKQGLENDPELAMEIGKVKHRIEKHFHINIKKDVLPLLGTEIGGYLTDVDMQGAYLLPRFLVFVKIKDHVQAQRLLDKLTQYPAATIHSEEYNHKVIHYVSLSLGANMDPGYCFLGDYLLVATSSQLLKGSIDAFNDSLQSIVSDDAVEQFSLAKGGKFHSVTLMKTAELARSARDILVRVDKYLSGQVSMVATNKEDVDNKKQLLDKAIADKSAELLLAQKKLVQLKSSSLSVSYLEAPDFIDGAIQNLSREETSIRDDIADDVQQKEDLSRLLDNYVSGARSAKLTMYNMDNVVFPFLKGLESIDAQAVTVRFGDKILETEFLVK